MVILELNRAIAQTHDLHHQLEPMPDRIKLALERLRPSILAEPRAQAGFESQLRLADSQWYPRQRLEEYQLVRLKRLALFAARQTAYGRERIAQDKIESAATLADALAALPILSRDHLRDHLETLQPARLPKGHRGGVELSSSGSTGMVVRLTSTNLALNWQRMLGLRAHLWAGRDFTRAMAVIRRQGPGKATYPDGLRGKRWGPYVPFPSGPIFLLNAHTSLDQQWEWLMRIRPAYLLTMPSILRGFARREDFETLGLEGVSTIGEVVDDELRSLVQTKLTLPIHDTYSSEEAGTMALQCPDQPCYHVQSEAVIIEVLDGKGAPCNPGEIGRVVVTPLHNYATPLLRYELNDFAEAGAPCACGRGLPVVTRIMGRRRNILVTPDGRQFWPALMARAMQSVVKLREYQFRQVAIDVIEVWLAVENPVSPEEEEKLREIVAAGLLGTKGVTAPFDFRFHYIPEFPRNPNGKHEEFISLIDAPPEPPRPGF